MSKVKKIILIKWKLTLKRRKFFAEQIVKNV
ncbi:MAG: hypothetical protein MRERC_11c035 [Mycoplasmataceae bacterium RC_NB112A]|nr:MAG: hypothetical protein MRERC_11c035 [Mycoplasmataceae bacterium RC_NB112A]